MGKNTYDTLLKEWQETLKDFHKDSTSTSQTPYTSPNSSDEDKETKLREAREKTMKLVPRSPANLSSEQPSSESAMEKLQRHLNAHVASIKAKETEDTIAKMKAK